MNGAASDTTRKTKRTNLQQHNQAHRINRITPASPEQESRRVQLALTQKHKIYDGAYKPGANTHIYHISMIVVLILLLNVHFYDFFWKKNTTTNVRALLLPPNTPQLCSVKWYFIMLATKRHSCCILQYSYKSAQACRKSLPTE